MEVLTREALETMADQLEASGEYRVVRKLTTRAPLPSPPPAAGWVWWSTWRRPAWTCGAMR